MESHEILIIKDGLGYNRVIARSLHSRIVNLVMSGLHAEEPYKWFYLQEILALLYSEEELNYIRNLEPWDLGEVPIQLKGAYQRGKDKWAE